MFNQVIWITGLSGSGKTTLGNDLKNKLSKKGINVILLDGDELRDAFGLNVKKNKFYSKTNRINLAWSYGKFAKLISEQGFIVIVTTISMFNEVYNWNKKNLPNYFEIYIKVSMSELRKRDPKFIYKNFDEGKIKNVSGLDLKIDEPIKPNYIIDFEKNQTPKNTIDEIFKIIKENIK